MLEPSQKYEILAVYAFIFLDEIDYATEGDNNYTLVMIPDNVEKPIENKRDDKPLIIDGDPPNNNNNNIKIIPDGRFDD